MSAAPLLDVLHALAGPLRTFVTVADHQHVTRAADELGLGQPTVSRAVTRLTEAVGVPLLVPDGRGVRLTSAGRTLAAAGRRALAELEAGVRGVAEDDAAETGLVALGFLHTLGVHAVPELVRRFRAEHPRARFRLVQGSAGSLLTRLADGEVDLVLTSPLPERAGLVAAPLAEQPLVVAVPAGHPLAGRADLHLADVAEEQFVSFEPGYGLRETTDALFAQVGARPRTAFEGQDAATVRGLVAAGLGVAVLPATRSGGDVVEVPLAGPVTARTLGLVWRDETLPRVAQAFRHLVLERADALVPVG